METKDEQSHPPKTRSNYPFSHVLSISRWCTTTIDRRIHANLSRQVIAVFSALWESEKTQKCGKEWSSQACAKKKSFNRLVFFLLSSSVWKMEMETLIIAFQSTRFEPNICVQTVATFPSLFLLGLVFLSLHFLTDLLLSHDSVCILKHFLPHKRSFCSTGMHNKKSGTAAAIVQQKTLPNLRKKATKSSSNVLH